MPKESEDMEDVKKKLAKIEKKLDQLLARIPFKSSIKTEFVPATLASLPEHLRKTASTIATMGQASAEQVAAETGRTRAAESDYLNQLASRGFLKKERRGREVYFLVFTLYTMCPQCRARVPMTLSHCPTCGASMSNTQARRVL